MNNIDKYLDTFEDDIRALLAPNVVLVGSNVLMLHGLNVTWNPEDMDIAIYEPTPSQIKYVTSIDQKDPEESFEACLDYDKAEEMGIAQRAWKKVKNGLVLNIILERRVPKPQTNLLYQHKDMLLQVNNIDTIIKAKLSYGEGKDKSFLRRKDAYHLSELKSANFNVNK